MIIFSTFGNVTFLHETFVVHLMYLFIDCLDIGFSTYIVMEPSFKTGAQPLWWRGSAKGPKVSVSNIMDIAFDGCSEIIRTRNFTIFAV